MWDILTENWQLFVDGYFRSWQIGLVSLVGALVLGVALAMMRVSPVPPLRRFASGWVRVFRNSPLTVVLFFFAFGLPEIGINASYFVFGTTALAIYTSAFVCEAVRSGINAVSAGQAEAARAIGLTFGQTLGNVVMPQALRSVVPPLGSVIIAMFKNSAVAGAFGIGGDLFSVNATLISARGEAVLPVLTIIAIGYLLITLPVAWVVGLVERRVAVAR